MKTKKKLLWLLCIPAALVMIPVLSSGGSAGQEIETATSYLGSLTETADGTGVLEGISSVDISAETGGLIDSIPVSQGDTVRQGQLILVLDDTQFAENLNSAGASVESSRIYLDQAVRERERVGELYQAGLSSTEEYLAACESVELRTQELYMANSSWTVARDNLEKTSYNSPVNGIVTALNVEEGEMAVQGTMNNAGTVLMTIEDMSSFMVRATMVESEIVSVEEGMSAEVVLDAMPDTVFSGTVEQVGLSATSSGGGETAAEFEVLVKLDAVSPGMRSGMSASVEIVTASAESCVVVPVQSIVERPDPGNTAESVPSVLVIREGIVRSVPVTVGVSSIMEVEVTGIPAGETVVSGPVDALRTLSDGDIPGGSEKGADEESGGFPGMGPGMGGMQGPPAGGPSPGGQGGAGGGR